MSGCAVLNHSNRLKVTKISKSEMGLSEKGVSVPPATRQSHFKDTVNL